MGVTVLQPYPVEKSSAQTIEYLTKRILELGATQAGHFLVDCDTCMTSPSLGQMRTLHVLHNSEMPASVFSFLETGTKTISLVADNLFDLLMMKMTPAMNAKKQPKFESKGPRFEYGDFVIKLGSVTMGQNFKGILIECEYRPCIIPSNCHELIKEFLAGFLGPQVSLRLLNPAHSKVNDFYQPLDTIQQYLDHFNKYRKQSTM
uniref:Mediator of RNA polymerase II transcription subunit 20 n=1 Tax=Culicoides sonorensis TaxID=179676 RepID=A0A336KZF4_CULSO